MDGVEGEAPPGLTAAWRTATLVVVALLGAAVLVALIFTQAEANRQRDRALQLQSHSYDVMILARTLSGTIARSEASLGRYVLSSDKAMGQLYFDEWRLAGQQIDRLDQITDDNRSQQPEINALREAYAARGGELSDTALSTSYGRNGQALTRYYQSRKAPSLARINVTLNRIIARERSLLDRRTAIAMASVAQASQVTRVLTVFGILLVIGGIALGWLTLRALTDRAIANTEAAAERERADELAEAVRQATEELRTQEARLRQVQKMEAVGQLTGGIAHDFNNMLAVVIGGLELARRNLRPVGTSDVARHLDSAAEGAHRAAALTRQLLAFAREDAINPEPIDAGGLIGGMRDLIDRTLGDAISVSVTDDSHGWRVRADRVQLENTILNLAVNARDAMNGRGSLTIIASAATVAEGERACPAGDYLTIAVNDTGCGMTPEVIERVFEPFFTTKPVGKGTGLGLSQIFGFVRQLGGEVGIVSTPGSGSTVTLYLPRDLSEESTAPVAELAPADPAASAPLVVLVVEDDPRVLGATLGALEELGHHAIACEDPRLAPAALAANTLIDLIISDVLMPHQTGPEMIAALGPDHAHVAVLFVTGYAGEAGEAGEFGGHHVLRKPFTLVQLERAIDTALAAERPTAPDRLAAE